MIKINKTPLDFEPRNNIIPTLPASSPLFEQVEMSEFESAFLCGLIKKYEPKKILEVGIAEGGTTAIILNCLESIGQEYKMYSVDVSEKCYRMPEKKSGFLAEDTIKNLKVGKHKLYLGKILPQLIDDIGGEIDFVILDTVHSLPGEILDFLVALPYLTENAVACLHDVSLNQRNNQFILAHATGILFSSVVADKMLNFLPNDDEKYHSRYSNIAAFQINSQTMKNIYNVFLALTLRWVYLPTQEQFNAYSEFILKNYSQDLHSIFIEAAKMNIYNLTNRS